MSWKIYNDFAWIEHIIAPAQTYLEETAFYIKILKRLLKNNVNISSHTMLHLGCGAGGHDHHFKKHFQVTGVDISKGMLKIARETNPEVEYLNEDMRTVDLNRKFDAVVIPDSIMYMTTISDLKKVISNMVCHLKPGCAFLIIAHTKEDFQNNNFVYSGEKEGIHITVFENNHIISDTTYEATIVYLIRQNSKQNIYHEVHTLGLFSYNDWLTILKDINLKADEIQMNHLYDKYLLEDGQYKLRIFAGILQTGDGSLYHGIK